MNQLTDPGFAPLAVVLSFIAGVGLIAGAPSMAAGFLTIDTRSPPNVPAGLLELCSIA
jgi:hypothetical protein